jgi:hypothetical protein
MRTQLSAHKSRIRRLAITCTLIAIVLVATTYAWFIGMQTVHVSSFDIEIAVTEGLALSLDGATFTPTVSISETTLDEVSYEGHTNSWGGTGLKPVSSVGEMDENASRMKLFEKASLTASPGGYRLLASRVNNYEDTLEGLSPEQDGYVVFDLFIRNLSGTQYIKELNPLDEEAIYLTIDSAVTVGAAGVPNTGIENSVRVAFAQIGRVNASTTDVEIITGITCTTDDEVTGICRTAQIWEPNDTAHNENALRWYNTSCLARTGTDVRDPESFDGPCGLVIDGIAYPTYAVKDEITSADNVDIYDGPAYNGYEHDWEEGEELLYPYEYFTDTMKFLRGTSRPTFMTLAPNSITKVRIYVYIEGQDVDNYDFASIGKQISVKFGFTKQRMTEDDIEYSGPDINEGAGPEAEDKTPPVITILGDNPTIIELGSEYTDEGAEAIDNVDEDLTESIVATGTVNPNVAGTYYITYSVVDAAGNMGAKVRTVIVQDIGGGT